MATIRLGDTAPNFTADSSVGTINFYDYLGDSWGILFSHPADFTPVCTTELGTAAKFKDEFDKRNVKMIALSVDSAVYELLRVIDSLQLTAYHKVATPANWDKGQDVVVSPAIPTAEAKELFKKGVEEIKPYLRMTPDPLA